MLLINELHNYSALYSDWNLDNRLNVNGNNHGNNRDGHAFGIALESKTMKTYENLYPEITSKENLHLAYKKARKRKTKKEYVQEFRKDLKKNLSLLRIELLLHSYKPKPLETFIIRDPKTRKINKSDFKDRIVHHALCNIIEPIFERIFIFDSYANRLGKGTLSALNRFDFFKRKVSKNNTKNCFILKADIRHYFDTVSHEILINIIKRKIKDEKIIWLIKQILSNFNSEVKGKGMPLGNLTSQFFANVYLNELDYFVKHKLKIKYYIRYVDDFVIFNSNKEILEKNKEKINLFLKDELKLELHPDKSKIIYLGRGVSFVGFRIFYYYKLLKRFNRKNIQRKLKECSLLKDNINYNKFYETIQGSFAYMNNANTYRLKRRLIMKIEKSFPNELADIEINRWLKIAKP